MCLPLQWPRCRPRMNADLFGLTFICSPFAASPEASLFGCCYSQSILAMSLRRIRPVSASRFRPGQRRVGEVAEGVAIGAVRTCRGLDHLDRDQPFLGVDAEGRAPGAGPVEIADRARQRVVPLGGANREAEAKALAHFRGRADI